MISWLYKWLPITFGCHCRADRSFFWKGKQLPICARCTGELVGMVAARWLDVPDAWVVLPASAMADARAQADAAIAAGAPVLEMMTRMGVPFEKLKGVFLLSCSIQ